MTNISQLITLSNKLTGVSKEYYITKKDGRLDEGELIDAICDIREITDEEEKIKIGKKIFEFKRKEHIGFYLEILAMGDEDIIDFSNRLYKERLKHGNEKNYDDIEVCYIPKYKCPGYHMANHIHEFLERVNN